MDFRHNAARRRRVMRDERLDVDQPLPTETTAQPFKRYQTVAVLSSQPSILDVLPKAAWLNGLCIAGAIGIAIGFLFFPLNLESHGSVWATMLSRVEWWSIEQPGSLGQLFLSVVSWINVGLCYQIYQLRRHRNDDYHGAYQVWKWSLIPTLLLAGMGTSVPAAMLGYFVAAVFPQSLTVAGTGIVLGSVGVVMVGLLVRLYAEVRESRATIVFLAAAGLSLSICLSLSWNRLAGVWSLPTNPLLSPTSWWLISVMMIYGMLLNYFGFVYRDVVGEVSDLSSASGLERGIPIDLAKEPLSETRPVAASESAPEVARARRQSSERIVEQEREASLHEDEPAGDNVLTRRKRRRVA